MTATATATAASAAGDWQTYGATRSGFRTRIPRTWNKWWVRMWLVSAPALIVSAFLIPFRAWLVAAVIGFGIPEAVSLVKKRDSLPPLTHTIRHFLPNWLAFPLIYFCLGSVGAHWLNFPRPFAVGFLLGLLGWLTDHFIVTYSQADPFPFSNRPVRPGTSQGVMPA